jgi:hypothetical protein
MATKKSKKKTTAKKGKKKPTGPKSATTTLLAASTSATAMDATHDRIFQCIVAAFDDAGLKHISSPMVKIVWQVIPDDVITQIGDSITDCLGAGTLELAPALQNLKNQNKVTVVSDLVDGIAEVL